jgi:hypothetical protein
MVLPPGPAFLSMAEARRRYDLIAELLDRRSNIEAAAAALEKAGPAYADEVVALLEKAETCYTPFEQQVVDLVREVTTDG